MALWQDVRFGIRQLRLNPGFTAVALISLALGVGANSAIFELIDAVRLRTLPVAHPEQLVEIQIADKTHCCSGNITTRHAELTYPQWEKIREQQQGFDSIMAWGDWRVNLAQGGEVKFAEGLFVSGDYFKTLQVPAILGRVLTAADDQKGCGSPAAVLSYGFWQKRYAGDTHVLGQKITLDNHPFEIAGVTPPSFFGVDVGRTFDVAIPICSQPILIREPVIAMERRDHWWLGVIGRLKPGWTLEKATAQLQSVSPGIFEATVPPSYRPEAVNFYRAYQLKSIEAGTGVSMLRAQYTTPLYLLIGIAALVLVIACANLANLMLARASARERELAIRMALGASRGQIVSQLMVESLLIALFGAAIGIWLAQALSKTLVALLSGGRSTTYLEVSPDWRVLAFTASVAILACLLFGLAPALRASRTVPAEAMKAGRGQTAGPERFGLRRVLATAQVAISLVLLVSALLFVRSLIYLTTLDAGFRQDGVLITALDLRATGWDSARRAVAYRAILDSLRNSPGIDSAATIEVAPISGSRWNDKVRIPDTAKEGMPNFNRSSAGYFTAMGTPLLAGRDFTDADEPGSPPVAIVNEAFDRKFLGGGNPVGKTIRQLGGRGESDTEFRIVGMIKNMKYQNLREDFPPTVFIAASQRKGAAGSQNFVVRSHLPLNQVMTQVKNVVSAAHPGISIDFKPLQTNIDQSLVRERMMALLSGFFGGLAVVLAVIGLYGVIAYMVTRRQNEIGIRMALGADMASVLSMVLKEALILVLAGLAAGAALTLLLARYAEQLIFGLRPTDPLTLGLAALGLAGVALTASYLPARRAAKLDPMVTLRAE